MKKLLIVIDVQQDFINEYTKPFCEKIEKLVKSHEYDDVIFTKFVNNSESLWYTKLNYKGCMDENGTKIVIDTDGNKVFEKASYTALNDELREYIKDNNIDSIYLCGFETDACVSKTSLDLFENNYDVHVLKDYSMTCEGLDNHNNEIRRLERLIGKNSVI